MSLSAFRRAFSTRPCLSFLFAFSMSPCVLGMIGESMKSPATMSR